MKILNLGCGSDTEGTHFLDLYPSRKEVQQWDLNNKQPLPYEDNYFDKVLLKGVLPHIINVGTFLGEVKRVLKSKGKVIVYVSNANYWVFAYHNSLMRWGRDDLTGSENYKTYHLFTDKQLYNLFEYYGLKIKELYYINKQQEVSMSLFRQWFKRIINTVLWVTPLNKLAYKVIYLEVTK